MLSSWQRFWGAQSGELVRLRRGIHREASRLSSQLHTRLLVWSTILVRVGELHTLPLLTRTNVGCSSMHLSTLSGEMGKEGRLVFVLALTIRIRLHRWLAVPIEPLVLNGTVLNSLQRSRSKDVFLFFLGFFLFFVSALAEGNRTPFDLPEAESELVAGAFTEYSGLRNLLFFLVEWGNLYVIGALCATMFLGGWQVPAVTENPTLLALLQFITFFLKSYFMVFIAMWVRGTLPRVRVDQLMTLCWKYLTPISFVNLLAAMVWFLIFPQGLFAMQIALFAIFVVGVFYFLSRVRFHLRRAKPELHLSPLA